MPPPAVTQKTAVELCAIAYCDNPQNALDTYLPGWTIAWNGHVTADDNYAFIATDMYQFNYVLCIRGSLPPWDIFNSWDAFANRIIEDLNAFTTQPWPYSYISGAYVASGTWDGFQEIVNMTDNSGTTMYG